MVFFSPTLQDLEQLKLHRFPGWYCHTHVNRHWSEKILAYFKYRLHRLKWIQIWLNKAYGVSDAAIYSKFPQMFMPSHQSRSFNFFRRAYFRNTKWPFEILDSCGSYTKGISDSTTMGFPIEFKFLNLLLRLNDFGSIQNMYPK